LNFIKGALALVGMASLDTAGSAPRLLAPAVLGAARIEDASTATIPKVETFHVFISISPFGIGFRRSASKALLRRNPKLEMENRRTKGPFVLS
jgi:hypothetical protein